MVKYSLLCFLEISLLFCCINIVFASQNFIVCEGVKYPVDVYDVRRKVLHNSKGPWEKESRLDSLEKSNKTRGELISLLIQKELREIAPNERPSQEVQNIAFEMYQARTNSAEDCLKTEILLSKKLEKLLNRIKEERKKREKVWRKKRKEIKASKKSKNGSKKGSEYQGALGSDLNNKLYESEQSKTNRITEVKQERIKSIK